MNSVCFSPIYQGEIQIKKTKRWVLFPLLLAVLVVIGGIVLLAAWTAPIDTSFGFDDSLNNGMRINLGVDVIRTLSEHYGISVPLVVDNAESVTRLAGIDTQVIRLVVSGADQALRVEVSE